MFMKQYASNRCQPSIDVSVKRGGGSGDGAGWEGQCECENETKLSGEVWSGVGDKGGCERRIEVIVKMKKCRGGGGGGE